MNTFHVTFEDGNSLTTGFNGTLADAVLYYVGNTFNFGDADGPDRMVKAVKVATIEKAQVAA